MIKIIIIVVVSISLMGCATIDTEVYMKGTKTVKEKVDAGEPDILIRQDVQGAVSAEIAGSKITVDTRRPTMWERFITPILQGAKDSARVETR